MELTVENLKEVIVSQAAELAEVRKALASEKSLSAMWLDLKCRESETLGKVRAEYDGLEELYAQRGDRLAELEQMLQDCGARPDAGTVGEEAGK